MIPITANRAYQVPCEKFSVYAPTASTQLSISIDSTNWTTFGDPFQGVKVYKDNPRGLFIKFSQDVSISY